MKIRYYKLLFIYFIIGMVFFQLMSNRYKLLFIIRTRNLLRGNHENMYAKMH